MVPLVCQNETVHGGEPADNSRTRGRRQRSIPRQLCESKKRLKEPRTTNLSAGAFLFPAIDTPTKTKKAGYSGTILASVVVIHGSHLHNRREVSRAN
jgi:hypothetical protein